MEDESRVRTETLRVITTPQLISGIVFVVLAFVMVVILWIERGVIKESVVHALLGLFVVFLIIGVCCLTIPKRITWTKEV